MKAMKIFVTHDPGDRKIQFHWALELMRALGEAGLKPVGRTWRRKS
jgi:hypothetical protein